MRVLIVEDELIISEMIFEMLTDLGYEIIGQARNHDEALEILSTDQPDICLLDINLGIGKDGIDLAIQINQQYKLPFVFVTSNADAHTLKRAKSQVPLGYLLKPFKKADLHAAIEVAVNNFNRLQLGATKGNLKEEISAKSIFVKDGTGFEKINFKELCFVKSDGNYIEIQTSKKKFVIRTSLREFAAKLPSDLFIQCHRSYLINYSLVERIKANILYLGDFEVPLSKQFKEEVAEVLLLD